MSYRETVERLSVRVLGAFAVEGLSERDIGSRKARLLLKLLACEQGRPVSVDRISDALWGDNQPAKPADQISVLVSRMRVVLGGRIPRSDGGYWLQYDWLDLDELLERSHEAVARLQAGRAGAARAAAAAAERLVSGRPLGDEDGLWADGVRAQVELAISGARHAGAAAALRVGAPGDAIPLASAALEHDPYDEVALQLLMRANATMGRAGTALAAYSEFREQLIETFGVGPSAETEHVHDEIVLGIVPMAVAPDEQSAECRIVGRATELAKLDAQLRMAAVRSQLIVIHGEPGIGKTALVGEWAARTARAGHDLLIGRCDQLGLGLPLQPVLDALSDWLTGSRSGAEIEALLADDPVLAGLLDADGRPRTVTDAQVVTSVEDPASGQRRLFAALTGLVDRVRGTESLVMIIDDVDNADSTTLAWLTFLVHSLGRVMVLVTHHGQAIELPGAVVVALGPLDRADAGELLGAEALDRVYARSGGNPLFLLELAHATDEQLPESVIEAVRRRSAALGPAASSIRIAALLGPQIDLDLLAGCCRRPVAELLDHIDVAVSQDLLVDDAAGLRFHHDVVREALVAGTTASVRAFVHREASMLLASRDDRSPLDAAHHAVLGGAEELAANALVEGAQIAAERFESELAEMLLGRAIDLADTSTARVARARVRLSQRALDAAADDITSALATDRSPAALELAGWIDYYRRRYATSLDYAQEAGEVTSPPELRASAAILEGRIRHSQGDLVGAIECLHPPSSAATGADAATSQRVGRVWLAAALTHQGHVDEALASLDAAGDPSTLHTHPFATGHAWFVRCLAAGTSGKLADAFHAADQLDRHANGTGVSGLRFRPFALNLRSWLERSVGNFDLAFDLSAQALIAAGQASFEEPAAHARLDQIEMLIALDRASIATTSLTDATAHLSPTSTMAWHQQQRVTLLSARLALVRGDDQLAANLAGQLAADADHRTSQRYAILARQVALVVAARCGVPLRSAEISSLLADLDRLAALDAWRLVAELAASTGSPALWSEAEVRSRWLCDQTREVEHLDPTTSEQWVASTMERIRQSA